MDEQRKLMDEQAQISRNQAALEERRFVADNRPRLVMREVSNGLHFATKENAPLLGLGSEATFFTSFSITNIGSTPCRVMESRAELLAWPSAIVPIQFSRNVSAAISFITFGNMTFAPGHIEVRTAFAPGLLNVKIFDIDVREFMGPHPQYVLALCGSIVYSDDNGTPRCTAFWREFDWSKTGFRKSENRNVEYED